MEAKLSKTNQSVEKTMRLVEVLAEAGAPMKLQDVAAAVEMPPSTALRMLNTLLSLGYVNQDEDTLRYYLSLKFSYIGESAKKHVNLSNLAHPRLVELSRATGECACLAMEQNREAVYLDVFSGSAGNILTVTQRIGKRAPLYCTGVGKLFLSDFSEQELEEYVRNTSIVRYTGNTIHTLPGLREELSKIREQGFALDNEECDIGASCVAAPVRDYRGKVVAGISVTAPTLRLTPEHIKDIIPLVVNAAAEISQTLSFRQDRAASRDLPRRKNT